MFELKDRKGSSVCARKRRGKGGWYIDRHERERGLKNSDLIGEGVFKEGEAALRPGRA